ncbi:programmed cell death 6-interacting protein-like [Zingiber officinale]|uniref:programmed cell death 6-interacting protein-like n=1 Tax=Zingiber officinale TaxID=94328 RepID=UPI001C4AA53A|nr:programmed cell death 6-interacting protein-like [Zingiber officinale]
MAKEAAMFWAYSRESRRLPSNVLKAMGEEIARGLAVPSTTSSQETATEPAESSSQLLLEVVLLEASSAALEPIAEERRSESLRAQVQELELSLTPRDLLDPLTVDDLLDSYLHSVGESARSARNLAQVSSENIKELQAALKTSDSKLNSKGQRHHQLATELEEKESELVAFSADLKALQESNKALQKDLGVARADLAASADREKALQAQRDLDQATIKSLQADLLKVQAKASTLKQENALALAAADKVKVELVEYRSGENDRLRAYRISYVESPLFQKKIGDLIDRMLCYGGMGVVPQLFEQGLLRSTPLNDFLDRDRLMRELPDEAFPSFIADDDFLAVPVPPPRDIPPTEPQP